MNISIHAPPRGATVNDSAALNVVANFNSRPSARGDDTLIMAIGRLKHFNSRPSARGDRMQPGRIPRRLFQFTPLREGRRVGKHLLWWRFHFNSRPSARGDNIKMANAAYI